MQIFLDSADIDEISRLNELGIIDGVTTNPSLVSKTKNHDLKQTIAKICTIIKSDVSVEVLSNEFDGMVREGNLFRNISENIVIKLPMTWDGIKACKYFRSKNMKVNLTLCFSANQALIAAKAGATYVSLFLGRLEDIGCDAIATLRDIRQIYDNYSEINTKILAASIRNSSHVYQSMISGADIATMPAKIIHQLIDHPLTSTGLEIFNNDWKNSSIHL